MIDISGAVMMMKKVSSWLRDNGIFVVLPLLLLALLILPARLSSPKGSYPPLLRWNDTMYKDTGREIALADLSESARWIGRVESALTLSERPTENLQSNLPGMLDAEVYQLADGNLAVCYDNAYWYYEILPDSRSSTNDA